jgi:hypothetical protein
MIKLRPRTERIYWQQKTGFVGVAQGSKKKREPMILLFTVRAYMLNIFHTISSICGLRKNEY